MKAKNKERLFFALCAVILAAALTFVFTCARMTVPVTDCHDFSIGVTFERETDSGTETVTEMLNYQCSYYGDNRWDGYYTGSGSFDHEVMEETPEGGWLFVMELEPAYLMGEPGYEDFYADGMPEPTVTYYDSGGNEYSGLTEAEPFGIRLVGCDYPQPIENAYTDGGVRFDLTSTAVLTAMAFAVLLLGILLVKKDESVTYQQRDRLSLLCNLLLGILAVPFLVVLEWNILPEQGFERTLAALLPAITVLGICASVLLRRKGKSKAGLLIQFTGPLAYVCLLMINLLLGFGGYFLFVPLGILAGILIAVLTKRNENASRTSLDTVSVIFNCILIPVYFILSLPFIFFGAITEVYSTATFLQEIIGQVIACLVAAVPLYCGVALGLSAALRKKGRSLAGFLIQFAGFIGVGFTLLVIWIAETIPWLSMTIN